MVFFHAVTVYHLLECILYRKKYESKESAVLGIPDFIKYRWNEEYLDMLVEMGFFDDYMYLPYSKVDKNNFNESLDIAFGGYENKYRLTEFDQYYIGGVHYYISIYLFRHGKKVIAFEEANAAFSNPNILDEALKTCAPEHYFIASGNGLIDYSNPNIINVICDIENQKQEFIQKAEAGYLIGFSIAQEVLEQDEETQNKLFRAFGVNPDLRLEDHTALIFTQHFMGLDMLSVMEQHTIYAAFIDLFFPEKKVWIKPHPDDFYCYETNFENCQVIRERFPAEFLPVICKEKNIVLGTIYSTSVNSIAKHFQGLIRLSEDFLDSYRDAEMYCVISKMMLHGRLTKPNILRGDACLLEALLLRDEGVANQEEGQQSVNVALSNGKSKEDYYEMTVNAFDIHESYISNDYLLLGLLLESYEIENDIYYLRIRISKLNEFNETEISNQMVWLYLPDSIYENQMADFVYMREFAMKKENIYAEILKENDLNVARLEGKVEAAAKRIVYYKEKLKEKDEQIAQYGEIKELIEKIKESQTATEE